MLDGTKNRPRARCSRAYVLKWLIGGSAWKFESVALPAWTTASSDVAITGVWIDLNQNWDLSAAHKQVPAEMAMCPSWIHNGWTVQQHRNCWGIQSSKGSLPANATRQSRQEAGPILKTGTKWTPAEAIDDAESSLRFKEICGATKHGRADTYRKNQLNIYENVAVAWGQHPYRQTVSFYNIRCNVQNVRKEQFHKLICVKQAQAQSRATKDLWAAQNMKEHFGH